MGIQVRQDDSSGTSGWSRTSDLFPARQCVVEALLLAAVLAWFSTPASAQAQIVVLEGVVVDSTAGPADSRAQAPRPLTGARVWARGAGSSTETDDGGRFRLELPAAGAFELTFHHPRLDSIGIEEMGWTTVAADGPGVSGIELGVPSWPTLYALWCGRSPELEADEGIVAGWVRSTWDGSPLDGVEADLRPSPGAGQAGHFSTRSADDGLFLFCSVPAGVPYWLTVDLFGIETLEEEVRIGAGEIHEMTFEMAIGGQGSLHGLVRHAEDDAPVAGAVVELRGPVTRSAESDSEGRFRLDELPAGRYTLEVNHLAFQEVRRDVGVPGGDEVVEVEVSLLRDAVALEAIVVEGQQRPPRPTWGQLVDVYERVDWMRRLGLGHHFDRQDLEESGAIRISHLISRIVGVRSQAIPGSGDLRIQLNQNRCQPSLYVDGRRVRNMPIDDVALGSAEVVEVYRRMSQLPGEFYDDVSARCGAIVIWTRRGP